MPQNQALVACPRGVWTELTNSDTGTITFQVQSGTIKVRATTGAAPGALTDGGYIYHAHPTDRQTEEGELRVAMAALSSAAGAFRLFATPLGGRAATVIVDHT
jgi:hypothetical protein